jgi:hypothetical protein
MTLYDDLCGYDLDHMRDSGRAPLEYLMLMDVKCPVCLMLMHTLGRMELLRSWFLRSRRS